MNPHRDTFWLLAALGFGVVVLPFLVYATGMRVLGSYTDGGAGTFLVDFLGGLVTLRWYSWLLALGPVVIVASWRLCGRLAADSRPSSPPR